MKKICFTLLLGVATLFIGGCGTKIESTVMPPPEYPTENSRIFRASYDEVWKATVNSIGESFFVLENIEKDSGIMSLSFSTKKPDDYIDCGTITDFGQLPGNKKYEKTYNGADALVERTISAVQNQYNPCIRKLSLNGKCNILVQAIDKKTTKVIVNTRYIVDMNNTITYYVYVGGFTSIPKTETVNSQMAFTSNEVGAFSNVPQSMQCRSKFTLEKAILDRIETKI